MTIGDRIRERRKTNGLSQEDLAMALNTTKQTIYKYEQGIINNIPSDKIELIAKALNCSPAYLMGWADGSKANSINEALYMTIGYRIKARRKQLGLSAEEIAKKMNVSPATVYRYESSDIMNMGIDKLASIAKALNCSPAYLMGWTDDSKVSSINEKSRKGVKIPVLGNVAAGIPIEAIEDIVDYEEIDEELADRGEYFGLRIKGDSMQPKFDTGDVVIVRRQSTVDSGDIAVVLVNGDSATVKKVKITKDGILLIPTNPDYEPMFYSRQEILDLPVIILGKVVELRAKF